MNNFKYFFLFTSLIISISCKNGGEESKPNVLFVAIDDLRPELKCYGAKHIKSPNIDRLSEQGILFNKAYCCLLYTSDAADD